MTALQELSAMVFGLGVVVFVAYRFGRHRNG